MEEKSNLYDTLPLATVIKVKNSDKLLMITKRIDNSNFDYGCVPFPEGFYHHDVYKGIVKDDIEAIYFMGCKNV